MIFLRTFMESIKLPNKKALFKLNRTGMDIVVIYVFIILLFVSVPALIDQLTTASGPSEDMNLLFLIIFFFIFYYLPMNILVFILLSIIAYISTKIATLMGRKLRFQILWKMSAFTATTPFMIYTIIALFFPISDSFLWLSLLYTLIILIKMISIYPKRKVRLKQTKNL